MHNILHLVNKSPFHSQALHDCVRSLQPGHAIVLYEDGVYAALAHTVHSQWIHAATSPYVLYALQPDLQARGLHAALLPHVQLIDYAGFVDVSVRYYPSQNWN